MADLSAFPEELLCQISDLIHPQTIVDWACTCKVFFRCSLQALEYHQQCRSELRVVHDRNPITIPTLLREGVSNPLTLWYIRSLDVWDLRDTFEQWKSPRFTRGNPYNRDTEQFLDWLEQHHDYSHLDTIFYDDEEIEYYRNILAGTLHLQKPMVDGWIERLRSGSDEILKLLLIALSPSLTKVTFVQYESNWPREYDPPLRMLGSMLRALSPLPNLEWPCFQNLKFVYVGYDSELRRCFSGFYPRCSVIAPLLLLPAIEELRLNLLMREEEGSEHHDQKPYIWAWEEGRSTCKKLTGREWSKTTWLTYQEQI